MFTSRAEFRPAVCEEDNADARLTEVGRSLGLVDDVRWSAYCRKRDAVSRETERLKSTWVNPRNLDPAEAERVLGKTIDHEYNLATGCADPVSPMPSSWAWNRIASPMLICWPPLTQPI